MKTFARHKTLREIRAQCRALGLALNDHLWRSRGHDHVCIEGGGARVLYNTFNGRFFGATDQGVEFSSDNQAQEDRPWFQTLLGFFYVEKPDAASGSTHPRKGSK